ncbi:MAG: hypothetical protein AAFQ41_07330, partial [Cyanobacteria bacterium J06623_7]
TEESPLNPPRLGDLDLVPPKVGGLGEQLTASLISDPLLAIANGDFSISNTTTDSFAWDTRGASGIEEDQAVLTEDSPFLSNFTQTFTVPEEAKTIQFKLIGAELGASELLPADIPILMMENIPLPIQLLTPMVHQPVIPYPLHSTTLLLLSNP